jgi:glutamyl/glutaminyl-tRNA synthetase
MALCNSNDREESKAIFARTAQALRVAVTGGTVSPPIFDTLAILGKEATLRRIDRCLAVWESRAETNIDG